MSVGMVVVILLVLVLLGVVPAWPHSRGWGYAPSGFVTLLLVVLLIMVLTGRF